MFFRYKIYNNRIESYFKNIEVIVLRVFVFKKTLTVLSSYYTGNSFSGPQRKKIKGNREVKLFFSFKFENFKVLQVMKVILRIKK